MTHTPHDLAEDFPGLGDRIRALKATDPHFAKLVDSYHDLNRSVHRAESRVDVVTEAHEADLRRQRAALKDQIARALR